MNGLMKQTTQHPTIVPSPYYGTQAILFFEARCADPSRNQKTYTRGTPAL